MLKHSGWKNEDIENLHQFHISEDEQICDLSYLSL